ncbi:5-hydroxytryptamine receptor 1-like protein [Leptotrombidium deliense]|uniref:5-hydroxytryptamine receptor 1-like protein n=1 Tax=Leptotrombidium deliense TaxID=299467 RepID=A0A443SI53_9ACAR|nr:5-hydroxytryptamine receptor 1-like protein [Leptotrombidium deliense]
MNDSLRPCTTVADSETPKNNSRLEITPGMETFLILALGLMIFAIIFGNILVCLSVILVRKLRHPSNYLLISLAIADLCVGVLVMPLALYYELTGVWNLGPTICDLWISFDQASCTASILNLCVISIDRYLAITQPLTYGVRRTTKRILSFIFAVWVTACLISVPPLLVFGNEYGTENEPKCGYSQNIIYQLYATLGAFYIPLVVMIVLYYKIYVAAKQVVEADLRAQGPSKCKAASERPLLRSTKTETGVQRVDFVQEKRHEDDIIESWVKIDSDIYENTDNTEIVIELNIGRRDLLQSNGTNSPTKENNQSHYSRQTNEKAVELKTLTETENETQNKKSRAQNECQKLNGQQSSKRRTSSILKERKASITLGVIMVAFVGCWLPFFIMALFRPFKTIPHWATSLALWLGFANSMLNPIIYVTFHQDFRKAFRYLLCLQCRTMDTRLREEAYQTQYGYCDRI